MGRFTNLYHDLSTKLDAVRDAAPRGEKDAGKAYADNYNVAFNLVSSSVSTLSEESLQHAWIGLELDTELSGRATDVINSVVSSWDRPAAKYMRGNVTAGDGERSTLKERLEEFDKAVSTEGETPVEPDE